MTAVLLDSKIIGATGWISVRRGSFLIVSGIEAGDRLGVSFMPEEEELFVEENGCFPLPKGTSHVRIEHYEAAVRENGSKGVDVDIVKKRV